MLELVDLISEDRREYNVTNFGKWKSQVEGNQGNATISDRRTEDFT